MNLNQLPAVVKQQIPTAQLPARYEAAKQALSECVRLDECKEWANRMTAIASYARQARDRTLEETAIRIRHRAYRRLGEMLSDLPAGKKLPEGGWVNERKDAAKRIGISTQESGRLVRIASVPKPVFEKKVEQSPPASLKDLDPGWTASLVKRMSSDEAQGNAFIEIHNALAPIAKIVCMDRRSADSVAIDIIASKVPEQHLHALRVSALMVSEWLDCIEQRLSYALKVGK